MGGSSKKVTVGYRYYMGLHFGVCYGPVDAFMRLSAGGRAAWAGNLTGNAEINVTAPELFGGDEREGGLVGAVDVAFGDALQTSNAYLSSKIGGVIPAFRGILSLIWKGGQISANNPYIKPFEFRVRRIKEGWADGTWYAAKAEVPISALEPMESGSPPTTPASLTPFYVTYAFNIPFSIPTAGMPEWGGFWNGTGTHVTGLDPTDRITITITGAFIWQGAGTEANPYQYIANTFVTAGTLSFGPPTTLYPTVGGAPYYTSAGAVGGLLTNPIVYTGHADYWIWINDPGPNEDNLGALTGNYTLERLETPTGITHFGMNPAHIIYQCITDPQWGMGYPTSQIDSANFTAAADLFYNEGLGLCMVWNQQSSIEDFVKIVLDHAGAILAVDPSSGQFILNPIRGDYDPGTLPVYDESNVVALESWQRVGYGDTVNEITVVYRDFVTNKDASVTVQDLANVQAQGAVVSQSRQYPGLPTQSLAARVAQRDLIAAATPLAKGRLTVNRAGWNRIPGDVIKLTWPKLGLSSVICRVLAVDTGTLEDGTISVEIAEDVFGLPASSYVAQESAGWQEPNTEAQNIANWEAVEAPYWDIARSVSAADLAYLTDTSTYLYAVAARPGDASLQYAVYTDSGAGLNRQLDGTYVPTGTLSAQLSISGTSITLADGIDLSSVEAGDLALIGTGQTAEWVEILTTSSPTFTIARGCLDTTPRQHAAATRVFIPAGAYGVDETEYATAQSVSIQLADISTGGQWGGPFDLRAVTMAGRFGRPYPPGNVTINGQAYPSIISTAGALTATWAHRDRTQQTAYVVHQDEASIGPEAGTTYTVRWYKPESTLVQTDSGISGTTSPTYTPAASGPMKVEITAVRGGLESWQAQSRSFNYSILISGSGAISSGSAAIAGVGDGGAVFITGSGSAASQASAVSGSGGIVDPLWANVTAYYPLTTDGANARGIVSPVTTATPLSFYSGAVIDSTHQLNGYNTLRVNSNYADLAWFISGDSAESNARRDVFELGGSASGSQQFTVECYAYLDSLPAEIGVLETRATTGISPFYGYGFDMTLRSGKLLAGLVGGPSASPTNSFTSMPASPISTGAWYHLCAERSGTTLRAYVNGVKVGENLATNDGGILPATADDIFTPTGFNIGGSPGAGSAAGSTYPLAMVGSIAGVRITKGVCRYGCPSTSFTPASFPYPES